MSKYERIFLLLIALVVLAIASVFQFGQLIPPDQPSVVLFTALAMLAFATLMLEHHFPGPTDVISASLAIILMLGPLYDHLPEWGRWYSAFMVYCGTMLLVALVGLVLFEPQLAENHWKNRASERMYVFVRTFGSGRWLFFLLFILSLIFYFDQQSWPLVGLALFAGFFLLIDPSKITLASLRSEGKATSAEIGRIFGVQSRHTFIVRLLKQRPSVRRFDLVGFRYTVGEDTDVLVGMIIDNYLLNEQQWVKVLRVDSLRTQLCGELPPKPRVNVVYKVAGATGRKALSTFVGVVVEDSSIASIKFDYAAMSPIAEGTLLEATFDTTTVLYQVVQGITAVETLESKNEAGLIVGEAEQLGVWNPERRAFEKHGWVPEINTPLFVANRIPPTSPPEGHVAIGSIPDTNYPALLHLREAVNHHIAVLGVTGSGKSVFARDLVRKVIATGTKVICVDFTNEYAARFADLQPSGIVDATAQQSLFSAIDTLEEQAGRFPNQRQPPVIAAKETTLRNGFHSALATFLQSEIPMALFELPDVANTIGVLDYTKWFFKVLFEIARNEGNFGKQVCVVLEEAHTIIPEWNSLGVDDKRSSAVVNAIGQIALQGRKYNVGFIVVGQRTANISKTVLTQCNTIIAFQQFDRTSKEFLSNYIGEGMLKALPTLKPRHAIGVGRGFTSGVPMIFRVPEIQEVQSASGTEGGAAEWTASSQSNGQNPGH